MKTASLTNPFLTFKGQNIRLLVVDGEKGKKATSTLVQCHVCLRHGSTYKTRVLLNISKRIFPDLSISKPPTTPCISQNRIDVTDEDSNRSCFLSRLPLTYHQETEVKGEPLVIHYIDLQDYVPEKILRKIWQKGNVPVFFIECFRSVIWEPIRTKWPSKSQGLFTTISVKPLREAALIPSQNSLYTFWEISFHPRRSEPNLLFHQKRFKWLKKD